MKKRTFDLTKERPSALVEPDANATCRDYSTACAGKACALACWLEDPTAGICPLLASRVQP